MAGYIGQLSVKPTCVVHWFDSDLSTAEWLRDMSLATSAPKSPSSCYWLSPPQHFPKILLQEHPLPHIPSSPHISPKSDNQTERSLISAKSSKESFLATTPLLSLCSIGHHSIPPLPFPSKHDHLTPRPARHPTSLSLSPLKYPLEFQIQIQA